MIAIGMKIPKPVMDWNLYGDAADWCNQNGAKIEERDACYEIVSIGSPSLIEAKTAKIAEITAGYDAAMTATLTMPADKPSPAEIALAALDFQLEDAEGLVYVRSLLAAHRDELLAAVDAATGYEDVNAITVAYPV